MPDYFFYLIVAISLFLVEILYFRLASHFGIIDRPNHRSSHITLTIRGGGVIFPIAILVYSIFWSLDYPLFLLGLLIISIISFYDDLKPLSKTVRLTGHLLAVVLLFFDSGLTNFPGWLLVVSAIVVIGTINAYNFMDGINGITGFYSISIISSLIWINYSVGFLNTSLLITVSIALLVFLFFNFRTSAKCFAGDVGSVSISFFVLFALALLIIKTGQLLYILFLAVYGVDTVLTILFRLLNRENIFEAHRSHAYQYLSNELGASQLKVSLAYGLTQLLINGLVIYVIGQKWNIKSQSIFAIILLTTLMLLYLKVRRKKQRQDLIQFL